MRRLGMVYERDAVVRDGDEVFDAVVYATSPQRWSEHRRQDLPGPETGTPSDAEPG